MQLQEMIKRERFTAAPPMVASWLLPLSRWDTDTDSVLQSHSDPPNPHPTPSVLIFECGGGSYFWVVLSQVQFPHPSLGKCTSLQHESLLSPFSNSSPFSQHSLPNTRRAETESSFLEFSHFQNVVAVELHKL